MITNINEFKKYLESKYDLYSTTINHNEIKEGDKVYTILGPFAGKDKYYGIVNDIKPNELFITFYEVGTDKQVSNNTQMVYDYIHKLNESMIKESMGDISLDEIRTERFNIDFRKKLDELFTREPIDTADWAGIQAWKISGETWDGYFITDLISENGGNDYNHIDYELIHRYDDDDSNVQSDIISSLDNMTEANAFIEEAKTYINKINEMSDFDAIANIGKITKEITIELDLKHSMHSKERQGRSTTYIKDSDIKLAVDKATEQIIDLLINNTLNAGDPVYIYDSSNNLNVIGTLIANKNSDVITFKVITVMISDNFYNKNKTYKVTV